MLKTPQELTFNKIKNGIIFKPNAKLTLVSYRQSLAQKVELDSRILSDLESIRIIGNRASHDFNVDSNEQLRQTLNNSIAGNVAGLGTEVATGLALDAKTQWMLGAGPWGWLGYGITNFAGGATANIAAQKLRGEEEISWGERITGFGFDTLREINMQGESNLHNIDFFHHKLLDPAFEISCLIFGWIGWRLFPNIDAFTR